MPVFRVVGLAAWLGYAGATLRCHLDGAALEHHDQGHGGRADLRRNDGRLLRVALAQAGGLRTVPSGYL